jgi:hypothetical protein
MPGPELPPEPELPIGEPPLPRPGDPVSASKACDEHTRAYTPEG